ncbi:protein phosphatase 1, regulatory subunit 13Bb isoform X1 [Syngnathus typhle]|uniref:protein phosphatase 1, regulatory subunit 13Bb isoform X1 n=1 Tax=Syngnathus typhle TaxID=161592 RepID=UPI002A698D5C|nr:protein phosphatase 1, regulatory subunit 13Bb isoform X1 [Syngnathus typhle]XP_061125527.1 protein phosphatase 1, regulatory subunit 13Bb isoform X1 [Syngnathus typhle]XP_061125528.1 protein phosphatase 1, regulatory subunit 13Bb isoform X1 [Syngnathus typhle]XP_061125529.1 protein phosphatase 1, regulatory subunit 13Bb isoform X1 [Syngnathus typhle]
MMPMILTVYLSDGEQAATEVPITPETTCRDVVEFCKEPGESGCHLAEVWRGNERAIPFEHMMYEHLQKWGPRKQEVKFFLRHEDSPTESSDQGSQQSQDPTRSGNAGEKHNDKGVGNQRVELTLSELQEMATRQQQQIEAQQQMLVAKEQRLRYLKQQERRQQQTATESEKLQRLKERVESQEAKLKKIRAMRGQVDYSKVINGNLCTSILIRIQRQLEALKDLQSISVSYRWAAEIEQVSGLFQEKQAELQAAVLRVDQLSLQLEDLRRGKLNGVQTALGGQVTGTAALELRKLYQELQIRNKLNQEQNSKLQQQKDLLNKRNMEVTLMDKRISELRERLYKKKAEARQKENLPLNRANGPPSPQPAAGTLGRVAAVGPYIQVPAPSRQDSGYALPPEPLKPQTLAVNNQANQGRAKSDGGAQKPPGSPWKVSDLDIVVDPLLPESHPGPGAPAGSDGTSPAGDAGWPPAGKTGASLKPPERRDSDTLAKTPPSGPPPAAASAEKVLESKTAASSPSLSKPQPPPYGSHHSSASSLERRKDAPPPPPRQLPNPPAPTWPRVAPTSGSSSQQIQQRISVPPSPTFQPHAPLFPPGMSERLDHPPAVAVRPFIPDRGSRPQSPRKGPATMNSSSIYHMYLQQAAPKSQPLKPALKAVYGKPVLPPNSTPPSPLPFVPAGGAFPLLQGPPGSMEDTLDGDVEDLEGLRHTEPSAPPPSVENIPRPLSPTKLTPMVHSPMRYQSDADLEVLRKKLANAPRPLKKRSSITEPEGPSGPNIQKLLYQRFNTLAGGMEGSAGSGSGNGAGSGTPFYQPANPPGSLGCDPAADTDNGNLPSDTLPPPPQPESEEQGSAVSSIDPNDNRPLPPPPEGLLDPAEEEGPEDNNNNLESSEALLPSPVLEVTSPEESGIVQTRPSRTNLKKPESERTGHGYRVKFNPLALLLDASLEGEFDLVQRIIYEVENPSTPNDEGITPLHNAVCAGHHHIVKFLLDFGVNVNAADSDGWTPLHCAASCNSVHLCKLLVESGAAIFASTISDVETAADKCEEMEEGYVQCSQFLYGVQEKMGVMNKGTVYALWDYEAQNPDELAFREGDGVTVLRRQDDSETEWWWAQLEDTEGYVPRNLLGLYPRIKPRQRSLA